MIVVFTDEAGDDVEALDATVDLCRKYEMPVYVIGVPAPLAVRRPYIKWGRPRSESSINRRKKRPFIKDRSR